MATTSTPKCPHCGYEFDSDETYYAPAKIGTVYHGDGDQSELTCPNDDCKKRFYVMCAHDIKFVQCDEHGQDL